MTLPESILEEIRPVSRAPRVIEFGFLLLAGGVLTVLAGVFGWSAGTLDRRLRTERFAQLIARAEAETTPALFGDLLQKAKQQRAALMKSPAVRLNMAGLYLRAAEVLPQQQLYHQEALGELTAAGHLAKDQPPELLTRLRIASLRTNLLMELGRDLEAKVAVGQWRALLRELPEELAALFALQVDNAEAYLLAIATHPRVRDPQRALALARGVIASPTPIAKGRYASGEAAYLDTLAEALYASGQPREAVRIQTRALALAEPPHLSIYLKHFDAYARAAGEQTPAAKTERP